jgi:hypothetical protein
MAILYVIDRAVDAVGAISFGIVCGRVIKHFTRKSKSVDFAALCEVVEEMRLAAEVPDSVNAQRLEDWAEAIEGVTNCVVDVVRPR